MRLYGNVFQKMGTHYCIVNSLDGYDEISLTSDFKAQTKNMEKIFSPADLGMPQAKAEDLCGSENQTKEDAMRVFDAVLSGTATQSQTNVVVANAAFAIKTIEDNKNIEDCVAMARESIVSGKAMQALKTFIEVNKA